MSATTTEAAYVGWFRPSKGVAWTRLADGPDYDTTLGHLVEALSRVKGGDSMVLRRGENPNARYVAGGRRRL